MNLQEKEAKYGKNLILRFFGILLIFVALLVYILLKYGFTEFLVSITSTVALIAAILLGSFLLYAAGFRFNKPNKKRRKESAILSAVIGIVAFMAFEYLANFRLEIGLYIFFALIFGILLGIIGYFVPFEELVKQIRKICGI